MRRSGKNPSGRQETNMNETKSTTAPVLLRMEGIVKRFGGVPARRSADFEVAPGQVHARIGQHL
mgnify:CR=1 FL=1